MTAFTLTYHKYSCQLSKTKLSSWPNSNLIFCLLQYRLAEPTGGDASAIFQPSTSSYCRKMVAMSRDQRTTGRFSVPRAKIKMIIKDNDYQNDKHSQKSAYSQKGQLVKMKIAELETTPFCNIFVLSKLVGIINDERLIGKKKITYLKVSL